MKILLVSQYFYPENFRINDLAIRLKERGHEVTILTGIPNYPQGRFYEGYTMFRHRYEIWNDMEIHRVPIFPRYNGALRLSINYLSFVVFGCYKARVMKKHEFDIIYAFGTSPITQALPALSMKKRIGAPVILHVQDLWPENVIALTGIKSKPFIRCLDKLVDSIYNSCDLILGTSYSFVENISARKNLKNKEKVGFWPQYSVVKKSEEKAAGMYEPGYFHIVFTGNVGEGQGISKVVEAAAMLRETKIRWHIVGNGRDLPHVKELAAKMQVEHLITFHGSKPESEIPAILNGADAALMIMNESPIFEKTIPAKFQTYLSCGCAVLGCIKGEVQRLICREQLGICTKEISVKELADCALQMSECSPEEMESFRQNALRFSEEEFDRERLITKLETYMKELL